MHKLKGPNHPSWKGGRQLNSNGYWVIWCPYHPDSNSKGYVFEHRLIMEEHIGRFLLNEEIVHHIDENRQNNEISNLQLINRDQHMKIHYKIDMSNRICSRCDRNWSKYDWFKRPEGLICKKCYDKERCKK
jgi:hypothetical protein